MAAVASGAAPSPNPVPSIPSLPVLGAPRAPLVWRRTDLAKRLAVPRASASVGLKTILTQSSIASRYPITGSRGRPSPSMRLYPHPAAVIMISTVPFLRWTIRYSVTGGSP